MKQTRNKIAIILVFVLFVTIGLFLMPMDAWAAKVVGLQLLIGQIQKIITILILPLSMIIAAWRIIYIAVFGGMMGMDPLNQISDQDKDGQISSEEVVQAIKAHLSGFMHGLMWIGGLFIIFQIALTIAGYLAGALASNF
jgi:hypothetical protein